MDSFRGIGYLQNKPLIYDGLEETVKCLSQQYPLFIVSNAHKGYIESFLEISGYTPYFTDHVCNGDNDLPKADNIRLIMDRHRLQSAVYAGDTLGDYQAAKAAGASFAFASYGFGEVPDYDYLLTGPRDLMNYFCGT